MKKIYIVTSDFPECLVREIAWVASQVEQDGADCQLISDTAGKVQIEKRFQEKDSVFLFFTQSPEEAGLLALRMKAAGVQGMALAWNKDTEKLRDGGFALASICQRGHLQTIVLKPYFFSLGDIPGFQVIPEKEWEENGMCGKKKGQKTENRNRVLFFTASILFVREGNLTFLEAADYGRKLTHKFS